MICGFFAIPLSVRISLVEPIAKMAANRHACATGPWSRAMSDDAYELVQVLTADEWRAVHDMRRAELFVHHPGIVYDENHPDDRTPRHFLFLLLLNGRAIGTARLDLAERGKGIMRMVAITRDEQRKGHGRVLQERFETFARGMGVADLYVNAARHAVGFYERMGFVHEDWDDAGRKGIAGDAVPMRKRIVQHLPSARD